MIAIIDMIKASLAKLTTQAFTERPAGYGSDLWCRGDLDPNMLELGGEDSELVAQALYRRLSTVRGSLIDDSSYGLDIAAMLSHPFTERDLRDMVTMVQNECLKDDRLSSCDVEITQTAGNDLEITLVAVCAPSLGTFTLTLAAKDGALLYDQIAKG